jgi:hypothetical protein
MDLFWKQNDKTNQFECDCRTRVYVAVLRAEDPLLAACRCMYRNFVMFFLYFIHPHKFKMSSRKSYKTKY